MNDDRPALDDAIALPGLPAGAEGPVFAAPWQAQIFAIVVTLAERGAFPWAAFQERLIAEIGAADPAEQGPEHYYAHWLAAAEGLIASLDLLAEGEIAARMRALAAVARQPRPGGRIDVETGEAPWRRR